ncbi:MAG: hypothetical protein JST66_16835 [Bacteroidetes bacterium]|nr:hypothetical protein [Bacteroidota bacterium]
MQTWSIEKILSALSVDGTVQIVGSGGDDDVYWIKTPYGEIPLAWKDLKGRQYEDIVQLWRRTYVDHIDKIAENSDPETELGRNLRRVAARLAIIPEAYWTHDPEAAWIVPDLTNSAN